MKSKKNVDRIIVSDSQEEPIIISSDSDVKIKVKKSDTTVTSENNKTEDTEKTVSDKNTKEADDKKISKEKKLAATNLLKELEDMPKELDEVLRKRKKHAKAIKHLQLIKDLLIKKFNDLQPIIDSNLYHLPEESETNPETEKNKIIVKDLKWRSLTLCSLLCNYIDRLKAEWSNKQQDELADHLYDVADNVLSILSKIYNDEYDADIGKEGIKEEEEKTEEQVILTSGNN
ncbi:hypothetical protein C1645_838403 [Glomus cerebriforme]|uniref:Uncharacterized protein n=1 Tax=Glomus cerebriforme TaxID=658196 RepID=A0A397S540_9GLOM|nr:hypothetical protein C1645_838403 [Glomus cerebriforme]